MLLCKCLRGPHPSREQILPLAPKLPAQSVRKRLHGRYSVPQTRINLSLLHTRKCDIHWRPCLLLCKCLRGPHPSREQTLSLAPKLPAQSVRRKHLHGRYSVPQTLINLSLLHTRKGDIYWRPCLTQRHPSPNAGTHSAECGHLLHKP